MRRMNSPAVNAYSGALVVWTPPPPFSSFLTFTHSSSDNRDQPTKSDLSHTADHPGFTINQHLLRVINSSLTIGPTDHYRAYPALTPFINPFTSSAKQYKAKITTTEPEHSSHSREASFPSYAVCLDSAEGLPSDPEHEENRSRDYATMPVSNPFTNPFACKRPLPPDTPSSPKRPRWTPTVVLPEANAPSLSIDEQGTPVDNEALGSQDQGDDIDNEERARIEQWKVGKRPGHQGSYVKGDERRKRTLNESICNSAEKVLKKPFRPPAKIVLAKAKHRSPMPEPSSTPPSCSSLAEVNASDAFPKVSGSNEPEPFPLDLTPPRKSHRTNLSNRSKKLVKPFKTPARIAKPAEPSHIIAVPMTPPSAPRGLKPGSLGRVTLTTNSSLSRPKSIRAQLREAREHAQTLRNALHLVKHPEEDEAIRVSIKQWTEAGREIADRLYEMIPKPEVTSACQTPRSGTWGFAAHSGYVPLTQEQEEYLRTAGRNEDGDPIDHEGHLILGDWCGESEIERIIEGEQRAAEGRRGEMEYVPDRGSASSGRIHSPSRYDDTDVWNQGAMLLKMGIDPAILGWDKAEEDWREVDVDDASQSQED